MSDVSTRETQDEAAAVKEALKNERYELLQRLEDSLETPMLGLAFVWLALYAFAVLGYVTATLATFFVGRDAENTEAELAGAKQLAALREEVIALRDEIRRTTAADTVVVKRDSVDEMTES